MDIRKIGTLFNILLLISINLLPLVSAEETNYKDVSDDSIIYIKASSPYDYGFKAGRLYYAKYKLFDLLIHNFGKEIQFEKNIEDQLISLEKYCPDFLEELNGLSESTGIKVNRLLEIQQYISSLFKNHCAITASTHPATKNGETFLTQNWDYEQPLLLLSLVFYSLFSNFPHIKHVNSGYKYVYFGIPVLQEIFLINEKGLGWGAIYTSLTNNESRHIDEGDGIPTYILERETMMNCANVSEVANFWKTSQRAANKDRPYPNHWDYASTVWCDKEGGILMIEQSHSYIITVFGDSTDITGAPEGILWHEYHHLWLDPNLTGSSYPEECYTSPIKTERLHELLEDNYGNITLAVCKSIMRDHKGGFDSTKPDDADICCHYSSGYKVRTAFSWIVEPKKLTVHIAHRLPCRSIYWRYNFTRAFDLFN